jgi:hypothetical protein
MLFVLVTLSLLPRKEFAVIRFCKSRRRKVFLQISNPIFVQRIPALLELLNILAQSILAFGSILSQPHMSSSSRHSGNLTDMHMKSEPSEWREVKR